MVIDLIYTDPPYSDMISYAELNLVYESWLQQFTDIRKEMIVSKAESKTLKDGAITLENGDVIRIIAGEVKKAVLEYEVVAEKDNTSLLRVKLMTGRFHQIRVQMASIGHPIIGDQKYGTEESLSLSNSLGAKDVCLVSYKYAVKHPSTHKRMEFEITPDNPQIKEMLDITT